MRWGPLWNEPPEKETFERESQDDWREFAPANTNGREIIMLLVAVKL